MRRIRQRLTYANVISSLCLVLVLGGGTALAASKLARNSVGTGQLKKNAVTGAKVKNGSLTGADLKLSTLGTVPSATTAGSAKTAASAQTADSARTAAVATDAAHATVADTANAVAPLEATHVVGAPGQPGFLNGASSANLGSINATPVSFYKDHEGIVHLEGISQSGAGEDPIKYVIFTLPPGSRPAAGTVGAYFVGSTEVFIFGTGTTFNGRNVEGDVVAAGPAPLGLISFRAGS